MVHGLSLVVFTALLFFTLVFFAAKELPLTCACKDGTSQKGTRGGLEPIPQRCETLCTGHGGRAPTAKEKANEKKEKR